MFFVGLKGFLYFVFLYICCLQIVFAFLISFASFHLYTHFWHAILLMFNFKKRQVTLSLTPPTLFYGLLNIVNQPIIPNVFFSILFFIIFFGSNLFISYIDTIISLKISSSILLLRFSSLFFNSLSFNSLKTFSNFKRLFSILRILWVF